MDGFDLFLERYHVLYDFYLKVIWDDVPEALLRQRPHPQVNSIAWNLWHVARVEDSALNRFVADRPQVLDEGGWLDKLGIPLRHNGYAMTKDEVDELSQQINLDALHGYSNAIRGNTLAIVAGLELPMLQETLTRQRVARVLIDEGLAGPRAEGLVDNYTGWSKAKCLMSLGLSHSYYHAGEMNVICSLLGLGD
jgi:hypothetical protein